MTALRLTERKLLRRFAETAGTPLPVGRWAPLLASALCLSACAAGPPGDAVGRYPAPAPGMDGGTPLAVLPAAAGRVVAVRQTAYANGFAQEIVLDGPRAMAGENRITVRALTTTLTGGRGLTGEELRLGPPGDTQLAAEMEQAFPGMPMRVSATPERDADGPVGVATGTAGRLACVYAWQYLAPARPASLLEGFSDAGALPMTLRVRLCGERPIPALLADLRGLRVFHPTSDAQDPGVRPTGDALEAAVGTEMPAPGGAEAAATAAKPVGRPAPRRVSHAPGRALRSARHRRSPAERTGIRIEAAQERSAPPVSRLPMPDEVGGEQPSALPRPSMPVPARTAAAGDDPLPLPH